MRSAAAPVGSPSPSSWRSDWPSSRRRRDVRADLFGERGPHVAERLARRARDQQALAVVVVEAAAQWLALARRAQALHRHAVGFFREAEEIERGEHAVRALEIAGAA